MYIRTYVRQQCFSSPAKVRRKYVRSSALYSVSRVCTYYVNSELVALKWNFASPEEAFQISKAFRFMEIYRGLRKIDKTKRSSGNL